MAHREAQFISRHVREPQAETKEAKIYRAAQQPGGYLFPVLRIGRAASIDDGEESVPDWNDYLNKLGAQNKKRGHARVLGEVVCHYVSDTEMRSMIFARDKSATRRDQANRLYRTITKELDGFLEEQFGRSYRTDPGEFCERPELMGQTIVRGKFGNGEYHEYRVARQARPERLSMKRAFTPAQLAVRAAENGGVDVYDGNVYGLNLSDNRQLYEERHEVLRFLKREIGLDPKNHVRRDWEAHATVFELRPHLRADDIVMKWPKDMPEQMEFDYVSTFTE